MKSTCTAQTVHSTNKFHEEEKQKWTEMKKLNNVSIH